MSILKKDIENAEKEVKELRNELRSIMNNSNLGTFSSSDGSIFSDAINFICDYCKDAGKQATLFGLCLKLYAEESKIETLKFADKRFEEFVERLKEPSRMFESYKGYCKFIDKLVEEFNCPQNKTQVGEIPKVTLTAKGVSDCDKPADTNSRKLSADSKKSVVIATDKPDNVQSQEIDVVGKPLIPSTPKTSGNVTSVTPDNIQTNCLLGETTPDFDNVQGCGKCENLESCTIELSLSKTKIQRSLCVIILKSKERRNEKPYFDV